MIEDRPRLWIRPVVRAVALLAVLAYLPAITAAPGRMPADSKLYLYLDPGRFMTDAAGSFDPRQFAGWVPHQHVAYLWPSGPWFVLFDLLGVPDWVAHRLWIGTIMVAAGLGVRWCSRLLGLSAGAALTAAIVYQTSLYVLPYVSRTSVMLLPWAGLGWIVGFTIRATRRRTWGDPAAVALIVLTVGAVNATALALIVPAPVLWIIHSAWQRTVTWRQSILVATRIGLLSTGVSLWWIAMLTIQARFGTDPLPYSESVADVSLTSTSAEVWRGLGYWLFYLRDPYAATTTASLRYLVSSFAIVVSFVLPIVCVIGLVWTRWAHRRFAALLIAVGVVLAVGVHPSDDRSPLMSLLTGGGKGGLALAFRSSTRAIPLLALGLAIAVAATIDAVGSWRPPRVALPGRVRADHALAVVIALLAIANLPVLFSGGFVDPALERDADAPAAWGEAAAALDASGPTSRVLQLPGAEFGAYRWGYTVDQPLPGLTEKPLVTRDLLPLGSAGAMDLLFALDDRIQGGVLDPASLAPVARLLGADTIWLTNDHAFERFRTARPEVVRDLVMSGAGIDRPVRFGEPTINRGTVAVTDERALGDPRIGTPQSPVELATIRDGGTVVRASSSSVVVSGSGDGLVDAAAAGLIDGSSVVRYSASLATDPVALTAAIDDASAVIVTDSNRSEARHWRSSQDTRGFTEYDQPRLDPLAEVAADQRLPVFATDRLDTTTVAEQRGWVTATATSYGEPFAYLPEHRPFMAIDGDLDTSWEVGNHGNPVGETFRLLLERDTDVVNLVQAGEVGARRITRIGVAGVDSVGPDPTTGYSVELDDRSLTAPGQPIGIPASTRMLDLTIEAVAGGDAGTASAVSGVGFAEISSGLGPTTEVVRPPHDALGAVRPDTALAISFNRLRSDPMNRWRDDPEPSLNREFELPGDREFDLSATVRIDARASDRELAELFGWPAIASSRLTGSVRNAGVAALDGDLGTAWMTAFSGAQGATLTITEVAEPIETVEIRQPISGFSQVSTVTLRSSGEQRVVTLVPDAAGISRAVIEPALPAGTLSVELTGIEPATTIDRRFADVVDLPAAITELTVAGSPLVPRLGTVTTTIDCVAVAMLDGTTVDASITITGDDWLDGAPLATSVCDPRLELSAGSHRLTLADSALPITLDGIVLDDGAGSARTSANRSAAARLVEAGRFERRIIVDGCQTGCWLTLGEGYNEAWSADVGGTSLGPSEPVDGGFNGWWLEPTNAPIEITVRWTAQRRLTAALVLSLALTALCVVLIAVDRRRRRCTEPPVDSPAPLWQWNSPELGLPQALAAAALWVALGAALIGPSWALAGALAGVVVLGTRHARLGELTALASLIALGAAVVMVERRDSPLPNGGWPTAFASVHGVGLFAVVSILVGVFVAGDATPASPATDAEHGEVAADDVSRETP